MFDQHRVAGDFHEASSRYAANSALQQTIGARLIDLAAAHVTPDSLLIDIGAGAGGVTRQWQANTIALDLAYGMCRQTQSLAIPTINAQAEMLPIAGNSADAVASNLMLQWVAKPEKFFAETHRVLKPGGIFALSNFMEGTLGELQQALGERRVSDFLTHHAVATYLQRAGFDTIVLASHIYREKYEDLHALAASIRAIGAANKRHDRPRGLTTPSGWREMEKRYPKKDDHLIASWVVQWVVARKK